MADRIGKPISQRQLRVGEMIKQSLSMIFIKNEAKVPAVDTQWKVKGNKLLSLGNPVVLEWNNNEGLIFKKIISLDERFLFKINQEVQNNSSKNYQLFPYAQIYT